MNHTTKTTALRFAIIIMASATIIAGTIFVPIVLQQHQGYAATQTKKQEQNTIQNLRGNFAKRSASQHLDHTATL